MLPNVIHKIDSFSIIIYSENAKKDFKRWASIFIYFYSDGNHAGTARFTNGVYDCSIPLYSDGKINIVTTIDNYDKIIDLLKNNKTVYLCYKPHSNSQSSELGDSFLYTGEDPLKYAFN